MDDVTPLTSFNTAISTNEPASEVFMANPGTTIVDDYIFSLRKLGLWGYLHFNTHPIKLNAWNLNKCHVGVLAFDF